MKRNQLTAQFVRSVTAPGRYHDGMGLFLNVKATGSKSWMQRIVIRGRRRDLGLGSVLRVSLAEARKRAFANWCEARSGGDPTSAPGRVPTFAEAAETVIAFHAEGWKDAGKSAAQWRASLRDYALPRLGRLPVDEIASADVLAVLVPIWAGKRETAKRVRQRIGAVMKWAVAEGYRSDNPAGDAIAAALPRSAAPKRHHRALPYAEVAGALAAVKASGCYAALALEFLALTAARSGEVRLAEWSEIDMDAAVWTVPAGRMKSKREHRVPLSGRALAILREAAQYRDRSGLVFPSVRGKAMFNNTLSKPLRDLQIGAVPHGFRSSFRDWAAELSTAPREVCELALAHVNSDKVEAAYRRSDLFDLRRNLMVAWADYLDTERDAKVIPLTR